MTNAITAASCRIEARSILSAIVISAACAIDVGDHCIRAHVERVVLTNLTAVGTYQKCLDRMRNGPVALARTPQFEQREHLVDFRRRSRQKEPAVLTCVVALRILRKFSGGIMLRIERYRDYPDVGSQSGTQLLRDRRHLRRQHRAGRGARS